MALKLTSGSASASVGVSATKIRATVDVINIQSSVSSELITAQTTYQLSNATDIWTDPDTKNRRYVEILPLDDIHFTVLTKPLYDSTDLVDRFANAFDLPKEDTIAFIENFSRVLHFRKEFNHAFTLDDVAQINKDYHGNKGNVTNIDDLYAASLSKSVSNSFGFDADEVVLTLQFFRDFTHSVEFTELYNNKVQKAVTDLLDHFEDTLGLVLSKTLNQDSMSVESQTGLFTSLAKSDSISDISDLSVLGIGINKVDDDDFDFTESALHTFTKVLFDGFALDDLAQIGKDFYGDKGNIFAFEEVFQRSIIYQRIFSTDTFEFTDEETVDTILSKSDPVNMEESLDKDTTYNKADDYAFTEVHQTVTTLPKEDDYHFTDTSNSSLAKAVQHYFDFGDTFTRSVDFKRVFSDYFGLDDAALINKDYTGNKGNIFNFSEEVLRRIYYKRTFSSDEARVTDSHEVLFSLDKSDSIDNLSDLVGKDASKLLDTDTTTVTEEASFYSVLPKTDSIDNVTDVNIIALDKAVQNSMGIGDEYSRIVSYKRSITDWFTLDDAALINKDYYGNKGNVFSFSEDFARAVEYKRSFTVDTIEFTEERTVALSVFSSLEAPFPIKSLMLSILSDLPKVLSTVVPSLKPIVSRLNSLWYFTERSNNSSSSNMLPLVPV